MIGLLQGAFFAEREERANLLIFFLYVHVVRFRQGEGSCLAFLHGGTGGIDGERCEIHSLYLSITFGTRKQVPSASGAFASARPWVKAFRRRSTTTSRFAYANLSLPRLESSTP